MTPFSRIQSLARHTATYGMGDLLGRAVSIILVPIYARHLSPADNGVVSLAFAFVGFTAVCYSLGLNPALVRVLSGKRTNQQTAFSSAFWTLLAIGLSLSALIYVLAEPLAQYLLSDPAHGRIFQLIALVVLLDTLSEPIFTLCRARQHSVRYAAVRLIQYALQLGLTAYLIAVRNRGPEAVFEANAVSAVFALLVMLPTGISVLRPVVNRAALRDMLAFGLPFVPSALAVLVINLSDRFLIRFFLGLDDLGVYGIIYKLGLPVFFIVKAFRAAWAPAVLDTHGEAADNTQQMCARITTYYAAIGAFICLILATFSQEFISLIAGDRAEAYLPGADVAPLVGLGYFCYGLYVILTAGIYAEGRAGSLPIIVGAGAVLNLVINLALLPRLGIIAAAWSTLAAYGLMVVLLFFSVKRFYPVPYEFKRLGKIAATAIIVFITLSGYLHDTTIEGAIARGIFLLGYPLILWGWQLIEPAEWQALRHTLNQFRNR